MKKQYMKPIARLIDFNYDEQVVASSIVCDEHYIIHKEVGTKCFTHIQEIQVFSLFDNCFTHTDKE